MKKQKHHYNESPTYKKWILERDKALEVLHIKAQLKATDLMRGILTDVLLTSKAYYYQLKDPASHYAIDSFEYHIKALMRKASLSLLDIFETMKANAYVLSKTSEVEIIARLNKTKRIESRVGKEEIAALLRQESQASGPMLARINMYLDRLGRNIISRAQSSAMITDNEHDFLFDVLQAFPKRKAYKRPPRVLKPKLMEAEVPHGTKTAFATATEKLDRAIDFITEDEWKDMVQDYLSEHIPEWRAPEHIIDIPVTDPTITATGEEVWYAWEFERDMTQEFVQAVRDGQIKAANDSGITDFVWIAILDSATDECCRWRDGLLISEIEKQLAKRDDECDGLTPPLHFNCRCALAPATDNIPDKPDTGEKDFSEWLES